MPSQPPQSEHTQTRDRARAAVAGALARHDLAAAAVAVIQLENLQAGTSAAPDVAAAAHAEVGDLWSVLGDYPRALAAYIKAVELEPARPRYLFNRAAVRRFVGDLGAAEQDYDEAIRLAPHDAQAWLNRSELRTQTIDRNHVDELERALRAAPPEWRHQVPLHYALAKEYEDLGDHLASWAHLAAGAQMRRRNMRYDVRADLSTMTWIREAFPAPDPSSGLDTDRPIFILGMPRTGSTLVERILGNHSDVHAAGELQDFGLAVVAAVRAHLGRNAERRELVFASSRIDHARLGADYLHRTRSRTGNKARFVDKLPLNYLYIGLIAQALPNARIVHVVRNPMATCYAVFKVLFEQGYPFSYDLRELSDYYIAYRRLMRHWHSVMPGRLIEISYESLVADPSAETARMLTALGLPWEPACADILGNKAPTTTASAAQVRRPIHRASVDRWRHYEAQLAPVAERLREAGINPEE
ncbi:MAG: sulfotransferase [Gammaproteobacteria bacterium]|nr:sulfotransferase [Gammaproteobacteria bacterium]